MRAPAFRIEARAKTARPPRGFVSAIREKHAVGDYALIAEIKKASPIKGPDPRRFRSARPAQAYAGRGRRLPVGADRHAFFSGHLDFWWRRARQLELPVLRKDSASIPIRWWKVRSHGADAILIIMAALDDTQRKRSRTPRSHLAWMP